MGWAGIAGQVCGKFVSFLGVQSALFPNGSHGDRLPAAHNTALQTAFFLSPLLSFLYSTVKTRVFQGSAGEVQGMETPGDRRRQLPGVVGELEGWHLGR